MRILVILLSIIFHLPAIANNLKPDSMELYTRLDTLLLNGKSKEAIDYMQKLEQEYPNYIPVKIAKATYHYVDGAQVEDMLEALVVLQNELITYPNLVSPVFFDVLNGLIQQFTEYQNAFIEHGVSAEVRRERFAVDKRTPSKIRGNIWCCKMLFEVAPNIDIPPSESLASPQSSIASLQLKNLTSDGLFAVIQDNNTDVKRKISAIELLSKNSVDQVQIINFLINIITDMSKHWQVQEAAAKSLGDIGVPALEKLISVLDGEYYLDSKKLAIWALIRMGPNAKPASQSLSYLKNRYQNARGSISYFAAMALNEINKQ
jgi:hypothetical protein